jgi:hypothetical protein
MTFLVRVPQNLEWFEQSSPQLPILQRGKLDERPEQPALLCRNN